MGLLDLLDDLANNKFDKLQDFAHNKYEKLGQIIEYNNNKFSNDNGQRQDNVVYHQTTDTSQAEQKTNSMYDSELENLIDMALLDGELTEKEKQVLYKKAESMGIDLDEFEMVLDARLYKSTQEKQHQKPPVPSEVSAPQSVKFGNVRKCPSCGGIVQSFQVICSDCGYAFEDTETNPIIQKLSAELKEKCTVHGREDYFGMATIIGKLPIPTTKGNLIELINFLQSFTETINRERFGGKELYKSCIAKLHECSRKTKTLFPDDKLLTPLTEELDVFISRQERHNKQQTKREKLRFGCITTILIIIFLSICLFIIDVIFCIF